MRCGHSGRPTSRPCMPPTAPGWAPSTSTRCASPCRGQDHPRAQAGDGGDRGQNFYREGGIDLQAIVRAELARPARRRQAACRAARRSPSSWSATSTSSTRATRSSARSSRRIWPTRRTPATRRTAILTPYLNTAPYGTNGGATAVGVQAAAETYFSAREPADAAQAAMIAGLPQAPSQYNPLLHPTLARSAATRCCGRCEQQGYISAAPVRARRPRRARAAPVAALHARARAVHLRPGPPRARASLRARHGAARRAEGLHDDPAAAAGGRAARGRRVRGLLRTVGPRRRSRRSTRQRRDRRARLQPALLGQQPVQLRRPGAPATGSSFKTFVLTTAIKQGIDPALDLLRRQLADDADASRRRSPVDGPQRRAREGHDVAHAGDLELGRRRCTRSSRSTSAFATSPTRPTTMGITSPLGINADGQPCRRGAELLHPARRRDRRARRGRDAAGDGRRLRHARRRRRPPPRDVDRQGRVPRRQGRQAGARDRARACSPRARPTRSRASSRA